jgi:Ca2+-binding RTX toxin-like protein
MTCALINPFAGDWLHENGAENAATITETTDAAGSVSTTYTMAPGDTFVGSLDFNLDWDWVAIDLVAGETYTISMEGGTLLDPYLWLLDDAGGFVDLNDDAGSLDSEIIFTPTADGTFYIAADSYYNTPSYTGPFEDTGTYTVTVASGTTPPPPPPGGGDPLDSIDWGYTAPSTINVYFTPGGVTFDDQYGAPQVTGSWSSFEQQQAELAFELFENVANVTFNVVTDPNQADFFMVESTDPASSLGYWGVGGGSPTLDGSTYSNLDGWGVFYNGGAGWDTSGLAQGGFGFITLIHEIGHGMGLSHPHDGGGTSTVMNGVTGAFGDLGDFSLNQGIYTTMTYNDGWQTAPHGTTPSNNYGYQGTPMAFDIALLQQDYGANTSYNTGNDTYVLPTTNGPGTFYIGIWDAGGTDTLQHNGSTGAVLDLREAPLSYATNGGGYVSYVAGIHGGFTIAQGAVIENAAGGAGADTITGNDVGNLIEGLQGSDSIMGDGGDDELRGNLNGDTIHGDGGFDQIYGNFGFDSLYGGSFADSVYGGNQNDQLWGEAGNDLIIGQGDDDTLWGGDGFDTMRGGPGDDLLYGGDRLDRMIGGIGNDTLYGEGGNDPLFGGDGTDSLDGGAGIDGLYGGAGTDTLHGGADNDRLFGGDDADVLDGGTGNDTMFGSAGVDSFVFETNHGDDVIRDFDANGEVIDLTALTTSFGALGISASGGNVEVTTPEGTIVLEGVALGDISQADFLF